MAFCTNCGTNVGTSIRFCTNCGTPQDASAPANAPLLEFGEQARAPQQRPMNFSAPVIAPTSSTNKQFILMLCIAQIAAPLINVFAHAIEYLSFEQVRSFYIPYLIASAISFSPFVVLAFIPKFQNDVQAKLFATVASAVLGIQGVLYITQGAGWLSGFSEILFYLSMLASISGIALAVLLALELKVNKSMLAAVSERWRAVPGFLAVLLLFLESPGLVIDDDKPFLSLILFPVIIGACLLQEKYRQGAAAGLGIVIIGSMVGRMAFKILSDYSDGSFISIPSFLALGCCLAVIAPNSLIQQKQASVPR